MNDSPFEKIMFSDKIKHLVCIQYGMYLVVIRRRYFDDMQQALYTLHAF